MLIFAISYITNVFSLAGLSFEFVTATFYKDYQDIDPSQEGM